MMDGVRDRKSYVDVFRGLLIAHMALDHASLFFNSGRGAEELAAAASSPLSSSLTQFLTRFTGVPVAPGFFFMAGFMVAITTFARENRGIAPAEITRRLLVRGLVLPEENAPPKISIQDLVPLENARISLPSLISIKVPMNGAMANDRADALCKLFGAKPGSTEVRLRLEKSRDFSVILDVAAKVRPDKEFCSKVAEICGSEAMEILAND